MAPQPDFTFSMPPPERKPRLVYRLEGWTIPDDDDDEPEQWLEDFTTVPVGSLPSAVYVDLARGVQIVDAELRFAPDNCIRFLRAATQPKDRARLDQVLRDTRRGVTTKLLGDVTFRLTEELAETPSGAPSNSPDGRQAPQGSSAPVSEPAATPSPN